MKNRLIYSFMAVLIFLQYLTPLPAIAQELAKANSSDLTLSSLSVNNETQDSVELKVAGNVSNEQDEPLTKVLSPAVSASLKAQGAGIASGSAQVSYTVGENGIELTIPAKTQGTFAAVFSIEKQALDASGTFALTSENQQVSVELPIQESTSESSSSTAAEVSETPATTESSSSEIKESTTQTTEASDSPDKAAKADAGTDIRTYFTDEPKTILTGSSLKYLDSEGNEIQPPVPVDTTVVIHYDWEIPENVRKQIKPGDYFEFNLPEPLDVKTLPQGGDLKNEDGETYATYTIDENGKVTMIFNENVTDEIDINGTFDFESIFDKTVVTEPGDVVVTFPAEDNLPPIEVPVKPNTDTSISKAGKFNKTPNPSSVTWTVDINQAMNELTNPQVTETWPDGLTYSSVKVYKLVMNLDGTVSRVGEELTAPDQYTVDENGNVTILGDTSDAYRVEYVTTIDDDAIPNEGGPVEFNNQANLSDDNDPTKIPAEASVTTTYGKMVTKNQTGYNPSNQEFSWSIDYNYGEKHVNQTDAVITDTMSDNMDLVDDSLVIYPITFSADGKEQKGTPLASPEDYVLVPNPNGSGFVVQFTHDVDQAYKIEYKTKVNGLVTDDTAVDNKVQTHTGEESGGNGNAVQQNIIKKLGDVNYSSQTAKYSLEINGNHYPMHDLTVHDKFNPVPGMRLATVGGDVPGYQLTIDSSSGDRLVEGEDYIITVNSLDGKSDYGFDIVFINDYADTSESFTVNYTTIFDISVIDPRNPSLDHFLNNVDVTWKDNNGDSHDSNDKNEFKPLPGFSYNAEKSGVYNAQTKEITWTINVNLSQNQLIDAFLNDPITGNQQYIPNSIKVYDGFTEPDGTVVRENDVTQDGGLTILEPNNNGNILHIDFPSTQRTYVIEFKTSVEGQVVNGAHTYDNVATYKNDDESREVTGNVSIKNGGSHIQKNGKQDTTDPNYMLWDLTINPSQSTLDDVVVHDYPSNNQVVDRESIKLYETFVATDGTVTVDHSKPLLEDVDYSVELITDNATGDQEIQVSFLHQIKTAYVMEYRSLISSSATGNTDTVSNRATIDGTGSEIVHQEINKNVTVQIDHSGGSASGTKGSITLQKTTEKNMILPGVHFQLWDINKTQILREGDTDNSGKITFGNLKLGDYLLVETIAPDGYTIPDDLVTGRVITISQESSQVSAQPQQIINQKSKVFLKKTGENGSLLAGAQFKLERKFGDVWLPATADSTLTTNSQGILEIDGLLPGIYQLIETKAPDGYLLDASPIEFTVVKNENNQVPTVNLTMTNYQGAAQLQKVSAEGQPLAGAQFNVVDANGKAVNSTPLISDAQGVITVENLAPGDYKFVEIKAPTDYILNTKEYPFTVASEATGKPEIVDVGSAVNYQGAASLLKVNGVGDVLAGAEFDVYKSNGQKVNTVPLVSAGDGKVKIDHLAPGDYYFKETKAPDGYILNTETYSFTVVAQNNGELAEITVGQAVNYTGSAELTKVNGQGDKLQGAEFAVYDESGTLVTSTPIVSDENGLVHIDGLAPGRYYFKETKAPLDDDGRPYVINDYPVYFTVPDAAAGQPEVLELGDFQNFKGKISLTKEGEAAQTIAGAEFTIYRSNDQNEEVAVRVVTASEDGVIDIEGLPAGSYKIIETKAPAGYIINTQPIYFVVAPDSENDPVIDPVVVPNYQVSIEAMKIDGSSNQPIRGLAGAEFDVLNGDGSPLTADQPIFDADGAPITIENKLTSDENGKIFAAGFAAGTYQLVETKAPDGYILDRTPIFFTVENQLGKPETLTISLGNINNYQGKFAVKKVDEHNKPLKGGVFHIENAAGEKQTVIDFLGNSVTELSANDLGIISGSGLAPGSYQLIEDEAPAGFIKNTNPLSFTIDKEAVGAPTIENGGLFSGTYVNYQGAAQLTKVNESGQSLADAVFTLFDKNGSKLADYVSDADGRVHFTNLAPGEYTVKETKAPAGYQLSKDPVVFTVSASAADKPEQIELGQFKNNRIPEKPSNPMYPSTSKPKGRLANLGSLVNNTWLYAGVVIVAAAAGTAVYRYRKSKKG
ncbi:SpaA isopeptide-forming pilin-related protein [Enterococcus sp. LJL51]|uniref:SpaA isopeptide-forming pilin-related protein n=1 Tax=Enterococcus sp. LJL51 TaxID=3416656 RepID=UPI003CE8374B